MIDLHTHSIYSDGTDSPREIMDKAARGGVTTIALTDHDTTDGLPEAIRWSKAYGVKCIPGIEISSLLGEEEFHILGYLPDTADQHFQEVLKDIREKRQRRNDRMVAKLRAIGVPVTLKNVSSHAGAEQVGRIHFARELIRQGVVDTVEHAFDAYLTPGARGYVPREAMSPVEAVRFLKSANAFAVLAHPAIYRISERDLGQLVKELKGGGLDGIEVYYPLHTPQQVSFYRELAKEYGLFTTGGTDYHGANSEGKSLGVGYGDLHIPESCADYLVS